MSLTITLIALISFLLGFFVNIVAFPYIIGNVMIEMCKYTRKLFKYPKIRNYHPIHD